MSLGSLRDRDFSSFDLDENGKVCRRTCDDGTHTRLESLIQAVGGVTNTTVNIYNITTVAFTEDSQELPANTTKFLIRARGNSKINFAYAATTSSNFLTIPVGANFVDDSFYKDTKEIFFQTSKADVIEIVAFSNL